GMPTFCKGWGKLPFDRSTPDITAHAILAMSLWKDTLPDDIKKRCNRSLDRMISWMEREQSGQGNWNPLWFGDQDAPHEQNLVYGAATLADYLMSSGDSRARKLAERSISYLLESQNPDGGWGGQAGVESKVTLTARAIGALSFCKSQSKEHISRGIDYLYALYRENRLYRREPIGLYFSRLWYSEDLYNLTFLLTALGRL
ncbi:MAG: squalene--hopene cyclase, partial [Bacteroidaceae bacterium]|nr:squalene--hopene cyclase [Bacteroidaceae bacterium]